jgi:hypothetical protein
MSLHAFINNKTVVKVEDITEQQWSEQIQQYETIINIDGVTPSPSVGWKLEGVQFTSSVTPPPSTLTQQQNQRIFGEKLAKTLVDEMGAINLELGLTGVNPDIISLLQTLGSIKTLLETGALKTARGALMVNKPQNGPYVSVFELGVDEITTFLGEMGYE